MQLFNSVSYENGENNNRDLYDEYFQIDAHVGSVNDIAFSCPDNQLCIITCGADMTIKVFFLWY